MNERKTENLVRSHFNRYLREITIEEQKSEIPKIDKLLKASSKKGLGKGYPEFIISFKDNRDLIVVVECKADIKKHKSKNRDKYSEYAVDGALLYASYLSKEYDVLAIAVSGEAKKELKVSHFLQLEGTKEAKEIFGDKLLSPQDYLEGYLECEQKLRQDYDALLDFSRELNQELHTLKIAESKRSLLISCILIALENKPFRKAYKEYDRAKDLSKYLVDAAISELKKANIKDNKLEDLEIEYSFIKTETSLSTENDVLKDLVEKIDNNINKFIKTHKYYDVLGQFYIEFLRYANSDKGLGIVLTPPHITELFAELAQVNKDSVVYDNCCGTGGFLISAMRKMVEDAKGDSTKIKNIKTKQIVGVEYQSHIFPLAISNMYIHQDGKTNIIKGSCFDEDVKKEVAKFKPNIGFLNPPYKADKKKDIDELVFVLNNLETLQPGGTCIAIVPMQSALAQKGAVYELKKRLLKEHTLETVLSMPNELFFNSKTNVITAVMIFTAHRPHPKNKETCFGYYKDDGFIKRKNKGRIDVYGRWKRIKEKWVYYYLNRKEEAGFIINKKVTAKDEWCAEAYMETNYSQLSEKDFIYELKKYIAFKVLNQ